VSYVRWLGCRLRDRVATASPAMRHRPEGPQPRARMAAICCRRHRGLRGASRIPLRELPQEAPGDEGLRHGTRRGLRAVVRSDGISSDRAVSMRIQRLSTQGEPCH
jgi:hypothetical protein